jgi:16S rRNA (uracil1498-N3)-methyltransferase
LYVAQSVLNSDAQISAIQKATEIGVKGIIPLYTDNCSVKETVIKNKIEKWQKIAIESVKQCERVDIPKVFDVSYLKNIIKDFEQIIVFAERDTNCNFFNYLKVNKIDKSKKILVIIGPEGGFSQNEFDFFKENNIPLITLGNLIYRADTALTAALTTVINGVTNE